MCWQGAGGGAGLPGLPARHARWAARILERAGQGRGADQGWVRGEEGNSGASLCGRIFYQDRDTVRLPITGSQQYGLGIFCAECSMQGMGCCRCDLTR